MRRILVLFFLFLSLGITACNRSRQQSAQAADLEHQGKTAQALDFYQGLFLRSHPSDPRAQSQLLTHMGECLERLDRVPEAYAAYKRAVEDDPGNARARLHLGEIFLMAGDANRASREAETLLKDPATSSPDALALYGAAAEAAGNDDIARNAFVKVLERDPGRVKVAVDLSGILDRAGDVDAARKVLHRSAEARPESSLPWLSLGRIEEEQGDPVAAEVAYLAAVRAENTSATNFRLGQFYERSGKIQEARVALRRADSLEPTTPTALSDFEFSSGDYQRSSQGYLAALQALAHHDASDRTGRRSVISRLIESELAEAEARTGAGRHAAVLGVQRDLSLYGAELGEADRLLLQSELALAADDLMQATIASTRALAKAPDSPAAHYISGVIRFRSADSAGARYEWQQAIDNDDSFVPARVALARLSSEDNDPVAALQLIVPAVRQEPSNLEALSVFGRALVQSGAFDPARNIAKRIEAIEPSSPEPHILRGRMWVAARQYASALIEFQQAVLLDPHSQDAVDGLTRVYSVGHLTRPAILHMEQVGMAEPRSAVLLEIAGRAFADLRLDRDAVRCLRESLSADPSRRSASEWLARLELRTGDLDSASRSAASLKEYAAVIAGYQAEQSNDLSRAADRYEQAVRQGDPSGVAANNLAWILARDGRDLDRALELAQRARSLQPSDPAVLDTVGFVHLARREYSDAVHILEQARELARARREGQGEVAEQISRHLAEAYLRSGQTDRSALPSPDRDR